MSPEPLPWSLNSSVDCCLGVDSLARPALLRGRESPWLQLLPVLAGPRREELGLWLISVFYVYECAYLESGPSSIV